MSNYGPWVHRTSDAQYSMVKFSQSSLIGKKCKKSIAAIPMQVLDKKVEIEIGFFFMERE
jgi:hypothetical protein